jgi:hypothetical protein
MYQVKALDYARLKEVKDGGWKYPTNLVYNSITKRYDCIADYQRLGIIIDELNPPAHLFYCPDANDFLSYFVQKKFTPIFKFCDCGNGHTLNKNLQYFHWVLTIGNDEFVGSFHDVLIAAFLKLNK